MYWVITTPQPSSWTVKEKFKTYLECKNKPEAGFELTTPRSLQSFCVKLLVFFFILWFIYSKLYKSATALSNNNIRKITIAKLATIYYYSLRGVGMLRR